MNMLCVHLETTYLTEIKNILLKVLSIKLKTNWNSIIRPINSTKKWNGTINSSKNKLNSKKNYTFIGEYQK